jgi:hypothetical protein
MSETQIRSDKRPYWEQHAEVEIVQKNTDKNQKKEKTTLYRTKNCRGSDICDEDGPPVEITSDHPLFWENDQLTDLGETAEKWVKRLEKRHKIVKDILRPRMSSV